MSRGAIAVLVLGACAASPDRPPVARIAASPAAVPAGDDFQTSVVLDGSASVSLDDLGAALGFEWHLLDDAAQTDDPIDGPTVTARFAGERPPRIVLVVTTPAGARGDVTRELQLTVR